MAENFWVEWGWRLATARGEKGLSQEQVARKAGISRVGISQIERGLRSNVTHRVRVKLEKVFPSLTIA